MGDFFMANDEEYINYLNTETKLCAWAFNHVDYTNNGDWRLCCKGKKVATKEKYSTIEEFWKGNEAIEMRKNMLDNVSHPICEATCFSNEKKGYPVTHRQRANKIFVENFGKNAFEKKINSTNDGKLNLSDLNSLEIRISNLCNLKCRMCSPKYSTKLKKDWNEALLIVEDTMPLDEIDRFSFNLYLEESEKYKNTTLSRLDYIEVKEILNTTKTNLNKLVLTGGEPFMEPYLYDAIEEIIDEASHINLQFVSNGTKFNDLEKFDYLFRKFKSVNISLSCDGIGNTYDYIRQGSTWEYFCDQAKYLSNYNVNIAFHIVVQIYNYNNITNMVDWVLNNFKNVSIRFTILDGPWYLSVYCLPKDIKEKMKNELVSYANEILNTNFNSNIKKLIHNDLLKIANKLNYKEEQKFLNQFAAVSDKYDEMQNVPITWRQLLPELNESLSKDSQAKRATE